MVGVGDGSPPPPLFKINVLRSCPGELQKAAADGRFWSCQARTRLSKGARVSLAFSPLLGSRAILPESEQGAVITNRPGSVTTRSISLDCWL